MSLSNPNKPVTEERLQEFYHKIVPYMGGAGGSTYTAGDGIDITEDVISTKQSEEGDIDEIIDVYPQAGSLVSIVNAFNRSDIYSTDEKMIGQWTDGKPLYQKTITGIKTPSVTGNWQTVYTYDATFNVVNMFGYLIDEGMSINTFAHSSYYVISVFANASHAIQQQVQNYTNQDEIITIQYTKTTDTAISIGSETEYSTDEKVVGTWITGEPIYQKTFTGLSVTPAYNNWTTVVSVSDLSVDKIMGVCIYNTTQSMMAGIQHSAIEFRVFNGSLDAEYLQNIAKREINIVTLQYTKSTT